MDGAGGVQKMIGKYLNFGKLGEGAFGKVYKGKDPDTGKFYALKTMITEGMITEDQRKKMMRELDLMKDISDHENVLKVVDLCES